MARSTQKEILDLGPEHYTLDEYQHCQKMLFRINKMMGIFYNTVRLFKKYPQNLSVLDVGCGGGLFLLNLNKYFPRMNLIGVDISKDAIQTANQALADLEKEKGKLNTSFHLQSNEILQMPPNSVDIILLTLVCHHLSDEQLIQFFQQLLSYSRKAVVIHDLHRHFIPVIFHKLFSRLLFKNRLISHDGVISIQRGFKRAELKTLLTNAGITNFQIKWYFPFRWRILLVKD